MTKEFNALKSKEEFKVTKPDPGLLETFPNPGVQSVTLVNKEFTSLCPVTGQPDYSEISITYFPEKRCIESKSLKLYYMSYRNYGAFTEELSHMIAKDLFTVLACSITVTVASVSRGGIAITSTCERSSHAY